MSPGGIIGGFCKRIRDADVHAKLEKVMKSMVGRYRDGACHFWL